MVKNFDVVILAAGLSARMGAFKPLLPFGKSTLIETVVETALAVSGRVIVVVGFRAADIINLKKWDERVAFAENRQFERGMFSSVKIGTAQVQSSRFFFALCDQPQIPPEVYRKLIDAEPADVVQPSFEGKAGHPILVSEKVRQAILAADENDPSVTLKMVLDPFQKRFIVVNDPDILTDFDTPEDYTRRNILI